MSPNTPCPAPIEAEHLVLACSCSSLDHVVRFTSWSDGDAYVDVSIQKDHRFWKKMKSIWNFFWNRNCRYMCSSEVIIRRQDIPKLRAWLDAAETGRRLSESD